MTEYNVVGKRAEAEITEKRSRFIAYILPVTTEEEAMRFVEEIKKKNFSAKHNVFAYRLKSGQERYSEDGEPQGTAASPILDMLKKENILDVVVVVTRYFGGILLGTGGLVRAYTLSAKTALNEAEVHPVKHKAVLSLSVSYSDLKKVEILVSNLDGEITEREFSEKPVLTVVIPFENQKQFTEKTVDLTNGASIPEFLKEIYK